MLTAAHCFNEAPETPARERELWTVHLGRHNKILPNNEAEVVRYIRSIHYHPNWLESRSVTKIPQLRFDIALVELNAPVPTDNEFVRPACLPDPDLQLADDSAAYVSGWGEVLGKRKMARFVECSTATGKSAELNSTTRRNWV